MKLLNFKNKKDTITKLAIVGVLLALPAILMGSEFLLYLACTVELYVIAVSGLDIVFGYCGQISLGHAAFYAIGAYGSAILHNYFGLPIILTMIIASIFSALIGALLAYPASKLVFHFLSLSTVAFGEIVYQIILHSPGGITGDFYGIFSDRLTANNMQFYYFGLICVAVFLAAKYFLVNSKTGRAFTAIRENTHAANGMGVNVRAYKVMAFATSAFYTAFAGAMYMHMVGFVHPDQFLQKQSVLFLTMLLFGGTGTMVGPVVGVISVEVLIEVLRSLQDYQGCVYGILLLIVIVALPGGLYGGFKDLFAFIKGKLKIKKTVTATTNGGDSDADNR